MERIQRALELAHVRRALDAESPLAGHSSQEERAMLRAASQPAEQTGLPRLAIDRARLRARKVVFPEDASSAARAYRMLRAQVLQRARSSGLGAIGIVSSASGEGKTLTAVNLALSLAADPNHSVTLIDLDLRRPSVAATLGLTPPLGLDTWLAGEQPVASVLYGLEGLDRLSVVPAVGAITAASEALAGNRTRELIETLRSTESRRMLIVDLPPALLSDHVLTVSPLLDGFVLVVTEGQTRRDDVERVFELLGRDRIIGTVLNRSSDSEQRAY
ncbi:MAG TPA: CpsD/CapB family tyrosine-protein kinase [Steroidobacteraceae bacterium]|nr:CpsD/CapB family tyrosine-protein kinase [Steroidobacteraceae bacterium]